MPNHTQDAGAMSTAPLRPVLLWQPALDIDRRADGTILTRQREPLGPVPDRFSQRLEHWARVAPDRAALAGRQPDGSWRRISYGQLVDTMGRIGQALLDRDLSPERPVVILSGNDLEHALLGLACMHVGVPYAPISPAYALISADFGKLRDAVDLLTPGLVFASDGHRFGPAITATVPPDVEIVLGQGAIAGRRASPFASLPATDPTDGMERAAAAVGPDTIAKFLFTSGSTGAPKAVVNTQRMLCANQEMVRDCYRFIQDESPVLLDWSPWHHTAGGNKAFGLALYNGGTFHIDDGSPTPAGIEATVRNLREISPTWYFNVPKGFEELVPRMDADADLKHRFFRHLKTIVYGGAGMAQHTWDALERLAVEAIGERVLVTSAFGATETAPFALTCTEPQPTPGNCGIPARGLTLKLVPTDDMLEARLRGPSITPGYWRNARATAEAFDAEGFYRMGDALRFADAKDPVKGFFYDGRVAENFKLRTGTWVSVGVQRVRLIDGLGGLIRDAVIVGADRACLTALVLLDLAACRRLAPDADDDALPRDDRVRAELRRRLITVAASSTGSSTCVRRILVIEDALSLDRGEITDKGSINRRAVLHHRAGLVEALYGEDPRILSIDD